jgi:hypothetical protein
MKISGILAVVGVVVGLTLLHCGAAFSQSPSIPVGAGVGVHRQAPGSRFGHHTHHQLASRHHRHHHRARPAPVHRAPTAQ